MTNRLWVIVELTIAYLGLAGLLWGSYWLLPNEQWGAVFVSGLSVAYIFVGYIMEISRRVSE